MSNLLQKKNLKVSNFYIKSNSYLFQNSIFHRYNSYLWVVLNENLIHPLVICSSSNLPLTENVEKNKWWIHRKWIRKGPRILASLPATESFKQFWYMFAWFFSLINPRDGNWAVFVDSSCCSKVFAVPGLNFPCWYLSVKLLALSPVVMENCLVSLFSLHSYPFYI